jgi:predicted peptidase
MPRWIRATAGGSVYHVLNQGLKSMKQGCLVLLIVSSMPLPAFAHQLTPDTTIVLHFPELPHSLYNLATGESPVTMASVYLPIDFKEDKTFPVVLWIEGGMGGPGDQINYAREKAGDEGYIIINLPLFKDSIAPLKADRSNFWSRLKLTKTDAEVTWNAYKIMLDNIFSLIPQIDKTNAFMGGFSNGGHATAILLNRPNAEILNYFNKFFFIEGGSGLDNYKVLENRPVLYMQGSEEKENKWVISFYKNAIKNNAAAKYIYMKGAGHAFPPEYHKQFREWLNILVSSPEPDPCGMRVLTAQEGQGYSRCRRSGKARRPLSAVRCMRRGG